MSNSETVEVADVERRLDELEENLVTRERQALELQHEDLTPDQ